MNSPPERAPGAPDDPLHERTIHFLPLREYADRGYHEQAVCGTKTMRFSISPSGSFATCEKCLEELAYLRDERAGIQGE